MDCLRDNLSRGSADVDLVGIVGLHLNFVAGWQESVEADDEVGMALEQVGDAVDDAGRVNAVG